MNLNKMMDQGIAQIMTTAGRFYLNNPKGRAFLIGLLPELAKSTARRKKQEKEGLHVPPFLIASIASQCNLHCAGCYARAGGSCGTSSGKRDMDAGQWGHIFDQAARLGVAFILLAGGEPFLRRDILDLAGAYPNVIFPIFTNGTMLNQETIEFLDSHRNLIPILSIEGNAKETDDRRGAGTHAQIEMAMGALKKRNILFGAAITVTRQNLPLVTSNDFLEVLEDKGCGVTLYVEYVPAEEGTEDLVLMQTQIKQLQALCLELRKSFRRMVILSFPGDEEEMGGCLASGRGFFHINPTGDAEPCPFSPHAKQNLASDSVEAVLRSQYFADLRELAERVGHHGGCTLFEEKEQVEKLWA
ncbi:4Fe-4S cluster-binding domain-containing protein [Acetobacterium wieringae]|uniref:4Fe-4S cluster-binding domain-containing protein n=1 Tax=Acetobacterium wieringae TaxID=52694 RepID=A0ABY6HGG8_9FIRM|nr:radical SAM/SPASM domain-containing protein [Acetobacterium wieringae]UYO62653.1 4Fe-4S cluster-binding domain-containing protein [Acetobacterium wieringae]VUZ24930.1 Putative mycofactocin radical SAM maturase MftC [Acetobacterium wieringae]